MAPAPVADRMNCCMAECWLKKAAAAAAIGFGAGCGCAAEPAAADCGECWEGGTMEFGCTRPPLLLPWPLEAAMEAAKGASEYRLFKSIGLMAAAMAARLDKWC